jgi:ribonuclease P protein component
MLKINGFPKNEKLTGEIRIAKLFSVGSSFIQYPIRVVFRISDEKNDTPVKVLVSVPKKKIRLAVNRNRIKRLIREAYRLNKSEFIGDINAQNLNIHIAFTYLSENEVPFIEIETKLKSALLKIKDSILKEISAK